MDYPSFFGDRICRITKNVDVWLLYIDWFWLPKIDNRAYGNDYLWLFFAISRIR